MSKANNDADLSLDELKAELLALIEEQERLLTASISPVEDDGMVMWMGVPVPRDQMAPRAVPEKFRAKKRPVHDAESGLILDQVAQLRKLMP